MRRKEGRTRIAFVCPVVKSLYKKDPNARDRAPRHSPFVQKDLDILERHFDVSVVGFAGARSYHRFFPRLLRQLMNCDIALSWFGDVHAFFMIFLARLLGKRSVIIIGGHDAWDLDFPPLKHRYLAWAYRNASLLLVVDDSLKQDLGHNFGISGANVLTLNTTYDPERWKPSGEKEKIALTISGITRGNLARKGLETFVRAAAHLPEVEFVLVGGMLHEDAFERLKELSSPNVTITGFLPQGEMMSYLRKAKVYCQFSSHEGLPNALCEAMLCECVPVGTRVYGIPTAMGDSGVYVPYGDPEASAEGVRKALAMDGKRARERIETNFPLERRERSLVRIVTRLAGDQKTR